MNYHARFAKSNRCLPAALLCIVAFSLFSERIASTHAAQPITIPLWTNGAPGVPATKPADEPVLLMSKSDPNIATPTAVIVVPGGAYAGLAMDHEGTQIADWLNSFGVTALLLKYRLSGTGHQHPIPMLDGQRAIRTVRARSAEWKIDHDRVGIIGFSAGGHLASTLGTHFDEGKADAPDPIDRVSSRPDFMVLCYPVISMTAEYAHSGSRDNLFGTRPDKAHLQQFSNESQVTPETPPTFIFHTDEDAGVLPENSIAFYSALRRAKVPAELHIYEAGRHGVGLAKDIPGTRTWPDRCREWIERRGLLEPSKNIGE